MRIISLIVQNFKNITIAEVTPTGGTVIISGENGAGKSALLDSFWMALDQKKAMKQNPDPIKHGEKSAKVVVNLGKYIVTRTWTETKPYLKIENAEGAVFKSPGAMLASLIGELSFDPQAFSVMSEKEQLNTLMDMLDLTIDIPELNSKRSELYDSRTLINRKISSLKGQMDGIVIPDGVPDEEVSTAAIMADYQVASDLIVENNKVRDAHKLAKLRKPAIEADIIETKEQLAREEEELEKNAKEIHELSVQIGDMSDPDLETFKCSIEDVEKDNELVRLKHDKEKLSGILVQDQNNSSNLTSAIEQIDEQKANAIMNATMPVPGLSFDDSGIMYNGIALKGCSAAEQLRVSVGIAMALNPKIRVIRITDGSLLDSSNMKVIEEMAEEHDFQVWIERVDESGKLGVFIQEGEIVKDNQVLPADDRARNEMPGVPMPKKTTDT